MKHDKSKKLQFKKFEAFYRNHEVIKALYTAMTRDEAWDFKRYVYSLKMDAEYQDAIWKYLNDDIKCDALKHYNTMNNNLRKKSKKVVAK